MYKPLTLLLVLVICLSLPTLAFPAAKSPADTWNYYHFDGTAFLPGPALDGSVFVAVREKMQPAILKATSDQIAQADLPAGAGAIAGICYLQSSGGKLGGGNSYSPYPRVPLQISAGGKELVSVQTDDHGFFVVVLPAGKYSIGSGPATAEITVDRGITTLVPLRVGKRMVD